MRPSEVRARVLADHAGIRGSLEGLERWAARVRAGEHSALASLRRDGEALLASVERHMGWEDRVLQPALELTDAWGRERAAWLERDHREQRMLLEHCLAAVRDELRPAEVLARTLGDLAALLRADMAEEERVLLDARVLRDDVVGIDVETG